MLQLWGKLDPWVVLLGSLFGVALLTPLVIRAAHRMGALDTGGHRRINKKPMPLLGGLAVAAPFLVVCILGTLDLLPVLRGGGRQTAFAVLGAGCLAILVLGIIDDIRGTRAGIKLLVQGIVALLVIVCTKSWILGVNIPFFDFDLRLGPVIGTAAGIFWIVGLTNAFNLIDGVDGVASGVGFIASLGLAVIVSLSGLDHPFVILLSLCLAGGLLAFLGYNFHPARVFLGDTGSMFIGFALSTVALMGCVKSKALVIFLAPMLAFGLPIFETLVSMLRRYLRGLPIFRGDQYHTHHRLIRKGFSQRQVAVILYGVTLVFVVSAVLYQVLEKRWIAVGLYAATILGLSWIAGYIHPKEARGNGKMRQRNLLLSSLSRYIAMSLRSGNSAMSTVELLRIARREMKLCYLEVISQDGHVLVSSGRMRLHSNGKQPLDLSDAPAIIVTNGFARHAEPNNPSRNSLEKTTIQALSGRKLVVRFQYYQKPENDAERQDIKACIAGIFEQISLDTPRRLTTTNHYMYKIDSHAPQTELSASPDNVSA